MTRNDAKNPPRSPLRSNSRDPPLSEGPVAIQILARPAAATSNLRTRWTKNRARPATTSRRPRRGRHFPFGKNGRTRARAAAAQRETMQTQGHKTRAFPKTRRKTRRGARAENAPQKAALPLDRQCRTLRPRGQEGPARLKTRQTGRPHATRKKLQGRGETRA